MTRPEDISERAWEAARLAVGEWFLAANLSGVDETIVTEGIARAIDAETERVATVVVAAAAPYLTASIDTLSVAQKMRLDEAHTFLMNIAKAIRSHP